MKFLLNTYAWPVLVLNVLSCLNQYSITVDVALLASFVCQEWLLITSKSCFSGVGLAISVWGIFGAWRQWVKRAWVPVDGCNPLTFIVIAGSAGFLSSRCVYSILLSVLCSLWPLPYRRVRLPLPNPTLPEARLWSSGSCPYFCNVGTSPLWLAFFCYPPESMNFRNHCLPSPAPPALFLTVHFTSPCLSPTHISAVRGILPPRRSGVSAHSHHPFAEMRPQLSSPLASP